MKILFMKSFASLIFISFIAIALQLQVAAAATMGISIDDARNGDGAVVAKIDPLSAGERAGLQERDIIQSFNGRKVRDSRELTRLIKDATEAKVTLGVLRRGRTLTIAVLLEEKKGGSQPVEKSLLEMDPVQGERMKLAENAVINGRVFERAGQVGEEEQNRVVYSNEEGFDWLEASIGLLGEADRDRAVTFIVLGDGRELYKSPIMRVNTPAIPIRVSIRGYTGLTFLIKGVWSGRYQAVWANPMLIKMPSTIPNILAPSMNARIMRNSPLVWDGVDGASGYLLELQAVSLANGADADHPNRFVLLRLPAETTIYNFSVNEMPKGKWRWRVHALSNTDIIGEMTEWHFFTSQ